MTRIIQDSDDDLDDDLGSPTASPNGKDALPESQQASPLPHELGTGSTDSLKTNLEAAHRAHFQAEPTEPVLTIPTVPLQQNAAGSSASPAEHRSKRRKTTMEMSPSRSPGIASKKERPLETYGRSKSVYSSPFQEEILDPKSKKNGVSSDKVWNLEGTIREEYAGHNPIELFPEMSSTVPNTTLTQQRLLEEVMSPSFLGIEREAEVMVYEPVKSSIPWSDYLKSSSTNTDAPSDPTHVNGHLAGIPENDPPGPFGDDTAGLPAGVIQTSRRLHSVNLSQRSRWSSSISMKGRPLRNEIDPETLVEAHPSLSGHETCNDEISLVVAYPAASSQKTPQKKHSQNKNATSITHEDNADGENIAVSPAPKSNQKSSSVPNSGDFTAIDLPREQYKPRPSRSRSMRICVDDTVDYSIRPERATKKRAKRNKTTGGVDDPVVNSTPRKVQQICEMGFTPTTTQRALKENDGDINKTVDWLCTKPTEPAKPASTVFNAKGSPRKSSDNPSVPASQAEEPDKAETPSRGRGRRVSFSGSKVSPQEENYKDKSGEIIAEMHPTAEAMASQVEDQQTKSTSQRIDPLPAMASKKPRRRKTTLDQPEPILEGLVIAPDAPKEKRRGRGRPRKEPNSPKSGEAMAEDHHVLPDLVPARKGSEDVTKEEQVKVLQESQSNAKSFISGLSEPNMVERQTKMMTPQPQSELPVSTLPGSQKLSPATESMGTPEKQQRPTRDAHSPLNKGKVPFRVGLSKRARIAPLLRVVKK
ncbi:hypothetical protein K469DRAFT_752256 [Zopfia rhizophila CBS 207.26]|uniref:UBA domain-containing protein n=1 Tax=Zopfia rhizophila CBS 207.26 TaxID=1314779 RepID=A0A6A6DWV8_9PEZI|nr:hypothetical protein K469DRAFT_752256 [Zopfia rhizophila CBS 207.26]